MIRIVATTSIAKSSELLNAKLIQFNLEIYHNYWLRSSQFIKLPVGGENKDFL